MGKFHFLLYLYFLKISRKVLQSTTKYNREKRWQVIEKNV